MAEIGCNWARIGPSKSSHSLSIAHKWAVVIQVCLWCVDSGCSKHITRNLKLLINFVWKFLGTFRFENDHVALKKITVLLQTSVIIVRTNNAIKFKNQVLQEYFNSVGISHQTSSIKTPHQNGVVKQSNHALVQAARTMLIFTRALLFLWAEAIATAKPDISFLHVFGALCYPKYDHEDIGKLGAKRDIGFFIGYSATSCAYRVYNQWRKKIIETKNVTFDELSAMAFEQSSSKPRHQIMTSK
ncbi:retrovirus-related pol polyprotein from transposon TNT 1-94 [Tanacetum coccineum]